MARAIGWGAAIAILIAIAPAAHADDEFGGGSVVFARGTSLWRTDARGKAATELVALPGKGEDVRAIRADAAGATLMVDVAGRWYWTRITDGTAAPLAPLACASGGATLVGDGSCVVCASPRGTATIIRLRDNKSFDTGVAAQGATVAISPAGRALVWAEAAGMFASPPGRTKDRHLLGSESPLSSFTPSPDGTRALGVYRETEADKDRDGIHELLYTVALDGTGARRKVIRHGVPIVWSWDSQWVLVQDRGAGCVMRGVGGEYKCWKGYTAQSIAPDGAWALLLGPRDAKAAEALAQKAIAENLAAIKANEKAKAEARRKKPKPKPRGGHHRGPDPDEGTPPDDGGGGEEGPGDEPDFAGPDDDLEGDTDVADLPVPLPARPFSLYRARRNGAYTDKPIVLVKDVDGAAVWLPAPPAAAPAAP
ncbi:MAG: hypothetical protein K8W52_47155 [Deltaproteobacteria bacterium]|nr:hypothetical protein [Deltaproteobacteria bacterium]